MELRRISSVPEIQFEHSDSESLVDAELLTAGRRKQESIRFSVFAGDETIISVIDPDEQEDAKSLSYLFSGREYFWSNLKLYVRELSETIEVHGIRYLFEEGRSTIERIIWLVTLIASFMVCIVLICVVHQGYAANPTIVSISTKDTPIYEIPFPAVTICSQVKANTQKFNFTKIYKQYEEAKQFKFKHYQYYYLVCDHPLHQSNFALHKNFEENINNSFFSALKEFSPGLDDIMFYCSFLGKIQDCSKLFKPIYTKIGLCYTFNMVEWKEIFFDTAHSYPGFFESDFHGSDWSSENFYKTNKINTYPKRGLKAGTTNALTVILKQDKRDIDAVCTTGIPGFKVTVHDPLQLPNFENHYFLVSMSTSIIAWIQPTMLKISHLLKALPWKQRKCHLSREERVLKLFRRYNRINCLTECLANFTLELCGCVPFYMPRDRSSNICGAAKIQCVRDAKHRFEMYILEAAMGNENGTFHFDFIESCACRPFCSELEYELGVSVTVWDWYRSYFNLPDENLEMSHFTIFFKDSNLMTLEKSEYYGTADLMASIGALLNLFVGSSLLTLVEIIYSFTLKILCNKVLYGPWAGPAAVEYNYVLT